MTTRTKEYILTESGNYISRSGLNLVNTQSIVLGGKTILEPHVTIRGDLKRPSSTGPVVMIGRYCLVGHGSQLIPPRRNIEFPSMTTPIIKEELYSPLKITDYVSIGRDSIVSSASIASCVWIGARCIISAMAIIKEGCLIEDDTEIAPYAVIPPFSRVRGRPGLVVGECPEVFVDMMRERMRDQYSKLIGSLKT